MSGNLTHGQHSDPIHTPSFRAKQADAFSYLPLLRKVGLRREKSLFGSVGFVADLLLGRSRLILLLCSGLMVLTYSLNAQAPAAVPIPKEPHHHLVFENEYVRVFRVGVPAHESTLLHQHDVPYLYVSLGPADVINAVQGKPEVHLVMADGQLGYSPGHFAHIARNESDVPFNNVTIELLKPQGEPHNLCFKVVDAPLGTCRAYSTSGSVLDVKTTPAIETEEVQADFVQIGSRNSSLELTRKLPSLLVALNGAYLQVEVGRQPPLTIGPGESAWLPGDVLSKISAAPSFSMGSSYLVLNFEGTQAGPKQ
jgi:hypothetical protein